MAKVHHNDIILTKTEAKELKDKLDKITTITELITIMKETYLLADIELELNWNPTFQYYKNWNKVIPAFAGSISGKNIDISGTKRPAVYSISCITPGMSSFDNLFRIEVTSGGGGADWSYGTAFIDIRDFPAMEKLYSTEISETLVKAEQLKFQSSFDSEVKQFRRAVTDIIDKVTYSSKIDTLNKQINDFEKLIEKLKTFKQRTINSDVASKVKAANLTLPQTSSPFVSLQEYNSVVAKLTNYGITEDLYTKTVSSAQATYDDFIAKNPELFV